MKKQVIILGAGGFLGKSVSSLFIEKGELPILYSKKKAIISGSRVKNIDITKKGVLWDQLKKRKVKAIIYLSAKIPKVLQKSDWNLFNYNLNLHRQVLDCWRNLNCHLIYASTSSVYNQFNRQPWQTDDLVLPDNYYSISKFIGELLFCKEARNRNLPLTILRINAPYGIKRRHKTVINIFIEKALKNKNIALFGSGKRSQDFIHVSDVAESFWLAYKKKKYGTFNIASGEMIVMNKLARMIIKLAKSKSNVIYSNRPDPEDSLRAKIDLSRTKKELGFFTKYSLEQGLKEIIFQNRSGL